MPCRLAIVSISALVHRSSSRLFIQREDSGIGRLCMRRASDAVPARRRFTIMLPCKPRNQVDKRVPATPPGTRCAVLCKVSSYRPNLTLSALGPAQTLALRRAANRYNLRNLLPFFYSRWITSASLARSCLTTGSGA